MKKITFCLLLALPLTQTYASTKILCSGKGMGKSLVINGEIENITDPKSGRGSISVDGREVTDFLGSDAKINYIFLSFKVKNSRDEILEGKVTDISNKTGIITRLSIPAYGIDLKDVPVTCAEII